MPQFQPSRDSVKGIRAFVTPSRVILLECEVILLNGVGYLLMFVDISFTVGGEQHQGLLCPRYV